MRNCSVYEFLGVSAMNLDNLFRLFLAIHRVDALSLAPVEIERVNNDQLSG